MAKSGGRCIDTRIDGVSTKLCTIGHVADALNRTGWTIRNWQRLGVIPEAPFLLSPEVPRTRRRLYPAEYVDALNEIAERGYLGRRLNADQLHRFKEDVSLAYEKTVAPLLNAGVTE
jgi:hypothetical protein